MAFSYFSANFSLFSRGGRNPCFSYFFPISGRRPEIPVLAGGQDPNPRSLFVPPGVPGTLGRGPEDLVKFMCPFRS